MKTIKETEHYLPPGTIVVQKCQSGIQRIYFICFYKKRYDDHYLVFREITIKNPHPDDDEEVGIWKQDQVSYEMWKEWLIRSTDSYSLNIKIPKGYSK